MAKPKNNNKKRNPVTEGNKPRKKFSFKQFMKKSVIWIIILSFVLTGVLTGLAGMGAF